MDNFLTKLYEDEREKLAAADLQGFMDSLSVDELVEFLGMDKTAQEHMSQERRESLPSSQFAVPESKAEKIGVEGEIKGEAKGKYPIPDEKHARNALARVSQFGSPAEREAVRSKVYAKYPDLKEGFKESHGGESPTSKENVKKEEQGNIGKEGCPMPKMAGANRLRAIMNKMAGIPGPDEAPMPEGQAGHDLVNRAQARKERGAEAQKAADEAAEESKEKESSCGVKHASAEATWADQMGRFIARTLVKEAQEDEAGGQEAQAPMEKEEEFSSPEAQAKAGVMRKAMKAGKGAPTAQRKQLVSAVSKKLASALRRA